MPQQAAHVVERRRRQLPLRLGVPEGVGAVPEQRLMRMHAAAVLPVDGLGHERREEAELGRHVLHDEPERRDVVGGLQRIGVPEIDLMLAVRDFVVRRLHFEPHALQDVDH